MRSIRIRKGGVVAFGRTKKARVVKLDSDRQIVFGWANVCIKADGEQVVDSQDDIIDADDLEDAAYNFVLNFAEMGEDHEGVAKGRLIESMFFSPEKLQLMGLAKNALHTGWWVGFHVEDKKTWEKVKQGKHRMFSIQGISRRREEVA